MAKLTQEAAMRRLTAAQRRALGGLRNASGAMTPRGLHTRSDVLWRLEEAGLVTRSFTNLWHITSAGVMAYEASRDRGWT